MHILLTFLYQLLTNINLATVLLHYKIENVSHMPYFEEKSIPAAYHGGTMAGFQTHDDMGI